VKVLKTIKYILFVLIIITITFLIIFLKENNKMQVESEPDVSQDLINEIVLIDQFEDYLYIKYCINKYYNCFQMQDEREKYINYYEYSEEEYLSEIDESLSNAFKLLDKGYIKENNLVEEKFIKEKKDYIGRGFFIDRIYLVDIDYSKQGYIVLGREYDTKNNIIDKQFIVKLDKGNYTFSLIQIDNDNFDIQNFDKDVFSEEEIENNVYNQLEYQEINDETISKEYFSLYKNNLIFNVEYLYSLLNEEYRKEKFNNNLQLFKEYINENYTNLSRAILSQYKVNKYDDYTQYICIDQNGNYYIFNETAVMKYTVMLDNYTVDLPEYVEKYKKVSNKRKTAYNIKKFIMAINDKSYYYAYNLLNEDFKNNYFNTQEKFEKYIKNNFYEDNEVTLKVYKEDSGLYTYTAEIKNKNNLEESKNKTFIVSLGEETNFELSFNIK